MGIPAAGFCQVSAALKLAYQCQEAGGSATCTLNAADEVAVEAFLTGQIGYSSIYEIVRETLSADALPDTALGWRYPGD